MFCFPNHILIGYNVSPWTHFTVTLLSVKMLELSEGGACSSIMTNDVIER